MGMAASQARLLSITSRMSDNELRAQIINNSKMRLASDSSRVSEEYINALNSSKMMFTSYDALGDTEYQELTFNALTNYSQYNTQYGLVDVNGKLLVSENETRLFKDADGDLEKYLEAHNLEYTTTYFNEEALGVYLNKINEDFTNSIGETFTLEELKNMYEGEETEGYESYENAQETPAYQNFYGYYDAFKNSYDAYTDITYKAAKADLLGANWEAARATGTKAALSNYLNSIQDKINPEFYNKMVTALNNIDEANNSVTYATDVTKSGSKYYLKSEGIAINISAGKASPSFAAIETNASTGEVKNESTYVTSGNTTLTDSDGEDTVYTFTKNVANNDKVEFNVNKTNHTDDGDINSACSIAFSYDTPDTANVTVKLADGASLNDYIADLYAYFAGNVMDNYNRDAYADTDEAKEAQDTYKNNLNLLAGLIFGGAAAPADFEDVVTASDDIVASLLKNYSGQLTDDFMKNVRSVYVLDQIFDAYGEPTMTWVDTVDDKENAVAKAQWYTNLFNRMSQGYKTLENGLAASNEWIQFAFESGLVTMEQVDNKNNWKNTIYSNCSNISEVSEEAAVAKAEAKYKKEMNDIEHKDKRFDVELKNIDTEHNSLQQEYESVKSVISKNVERTFKMYS